MSTLICSACGSTKLRRQADGRYRCSSCAATMTALEAARKTGRKPGGRWTTALLWLTVVGIVMAALWQMVAL